MICCCRVASVPLCHVRHGDKAALLSCERWLSLQALDLQVLLLLLTSDSCPGTYHDNDMLHTVGHFQHHGSVNAIPPAYSQSVLLVWNDSVR